MKIYIVRFWSLSGGRIKRIFRDFNHAFMYAVKLWFREAERFEKIRKFIEKMNLGSVGIENLELVEEFAVEVRKGGRVREWAIPVKKVVMRTGVEVVEEITIEEWEVSD